MEPDDCEEELHALFRSDVPDNLSNDLLALAHLSDVEEQSVVSAGPVRRQRRVAKSTDPYMRNKRKSDQELLDDDIKELEFRTRAWKPFRTVNTSQHKPDPKSDI